MRALRDQDPANVRESVQGYGEEWCDEGDDGQKMKLAPTAFERLREIPGLPHVLGVCGILFSIVYTIIEEGDGFRNAFLGSHIEESETNYQPFQYLILEKRCFELFLRIS